MGCQRPPGFGESQKRKFMAMISYFHIRIIFKAPSPNKEDFRRDFEDCSSQENKGERARWSVTWRDGERVRGKERAPKIERRGDVELRFRQKTDTDRKSKDSDTDEGFFFSLFLLFQNQMIRVGCLGVLNLYFTVLFLFFSMLILGSL